MIVWGWRRYAQTIAMITFVCGTCGNPAAHSLRGFVTKFTLFFVPLFPVHRSFQVQCTFCGAAGKVTREQAEAMRAQSQGPVAPGPQPAQPTAHIPQYPHQQYSHQQFPPTQPPLEQTVQFPHLPYGTGAPAQPGQPG